MTAQGDTLTDNLPPRSLSQKLLVWILGRPLWVISVTGLLTLFLAWGLPRLKVGTSVYDLVIEDLKETKQYQSFKQDFESDEIIRIVVRCRDIFDAPGYGVPRSGPDQAGGKVGEGGGRE